MTDHVVIAAAARKIDSAEKFTREHKIPHAYGSYGELLQRNDIDVVYIGSINTQHLPLVKLSLEHGKHVLCEKPLCLNVKETTEVIELAREKGLFLMEAIWSRFSPAYKEISETMMKKIGTPESITVNFNDNLADVANCSKKSFGGGAMLNIGIYCIQLISFIFGGVKPDKIIAKGQLNSDGVDELVKATLMYPGGKEAILTTSITRSSKAEATITGSLGTIKIHDPFFFPTEVTVLDKEQSFPLPDPDFPQTFNYRNAIGLRYEAEEVRNCIKNDLTESPVLPWKESLLISEIMETILKQVGVSYE